MHAIIKVRPHRSGGWEAFEAPGVQPFYGTKELALSYARQRFGERSGELQIYDSAGKLEQTIEVDPSQRFPCLPFSPGAGNQRPG